MMGCGDGLTAFLFILFVIDTTLIINRVRLHIAGWTLSLNGWLVTAT